MKCLNCDQEMKEIGTTQQMDQDMKNINNWICLSCGLVTSLNNFYYDQDQLSDFLEMCDIDEQDKKQVKNNITEYVME